jgi:uncharacterized protein YndB with AHSA1/START domain
VRKSFAVKARPDRAFEVFAAGMGRWWPQSHHIGEGELAEVVIEPHVGGRWYEVSSTGATCNWGRVLVWDPPRELVLAWQLSADWTYDPAIESEVAVTFTPEGEGTRVDFEHRGLETYGQRAEEVTKSVGSPGGWPAILDAFAALVDG